MTERPLPPSSAEGDSVAVGLSVGSVGDGSSVGLGSSVGSS